MRINNSGARTVSVPTAPAPASDWQRIIDNQGKSTNAYTQTQPGFGQPGFVGYSDTYAPSAASAPASPTRLTPSPTSAEVQQSNQDFFQECLRDDYGNCLTPSTAYDSWDFMGTGPVSPVRIQGSDFGYDPLNPDGPPVRMVPATQAPARVEDRSFNATQNSGLQPYAPAPTPVNGGIYDDGVLVGQRTGSGADLAPTYMTGWNWFDCTILRACNTAQTAPAEQYPAPVTSLTPVPNLSTGDQEAFEEAYRPDGKERPPLIYYPLTLDQLKRINAASTDNNGTLSTGDQEAFEAGYQQTPDYYSVFDDLNVGYDPGGDNSSVYEPNTSYDLNAGYDPGRDYFDWGSFQPVDDGAWYNFGWSDI